MPTTNTRANWLRFGAFLSPSAPCLRLHWALTTGHYSHAPRHPRRHPPGPAGSGRAQTLPRWQLPDTNSRIGKDRTGPGLLSSPSVFSMSPNQATPAEKSIRFSPLAAVQPLNILSGPETHNASGSRRACRMAISRNPRSPPRFPEFAQAVRYGVLASGKLWEGGRDLNSETFR